MPDEPDQPVEPIDPDDDDQDGIELPDADDALPDVVTDDPEE